MRLLLLICVLLGTTFGLWFNLHSQETPATEVETGSSFEGTLLLPGNAPVEGVIVILTLAGDQKLNKKDSVVINCVNKKLKPDLVAMSEDQNLVIANPSDFSHNIYSPSETYPFDLKVLGRQDSIGKTLPAPDTTLKPGRLDVYCSFYASAQATVYITPANQIATAVNRDGSFRFDNLPDGEYVLSTWQKDKRYLNLHSQNITVPTRRRHIFRFRR